MANIPTLNELYISIKTDLESKLGVSINVFGKTYLNALAMVQAGTLKLFYLTIARVQKNIFVDTADPEAIGGTLERFGRVKLGRDPFPATQGKYVVIVTGDTAATVPAGQTFKSNDDSQSPGKLFILDVAKVLGAPSDTMELRALEAGLDSQLAVNDLLTATSPILNVDSVVTVQSESEEPKSAEDLEDYRAKAIEAYQLEPQGGAASDYRIWSADAQGVRKVYPYAKSGAANELELFVEATIADSTDGKGTPTVAILDDVKDVVEFDPDTTKPPEERGRRPLGIFNIDFLAISPLDVDITITNPINFDAATETAVENAIIAELLVVRPFVPGADVEANRNDNLSVNKLIFIVQSVISDDQFFDTLTFEVDGVPIPASKTFENGDIPFLTSITYV